MSNPTFWRLIDHLGRKAGGALWSVAIAPKVQAWMEANQEHVEEILGEIRLAVKEGRL